MSSAKGALFALLGIFALAQPGFAQDKPYKEDRSGR